MNTRTPNGWGESTKPWSSHEFRQRPLNQPLHLHPNRLVARDMIDVGSVDPKTADRSPMNTRTASGSVGSYWSFTSVRIVSPLGFSRLAAAERAMSRMMLTEYFRLVTTYPW